ncbi:MAG: hypothetical protein AAGI88_25565, partial [Pseudomonadota bacterium]
KRLKQFSFSAAQLSTLPVLLLTLVFGTQYVQRYLNEGPTYRVLAEVEGDSGPFRVRAVHARVESSDTEVLRLYVQSDNGVANIREAVVELDDGTALALRPVFYGPATILEAVVEPGGTGGTPVLGAYGLTLVDGSTQEIRFSAVSSSTYSNMSAG